nr:hypothetical protein [Tanacetum cinerariifolium]
MQQKSSHRGFQKQTTTRALELMSPTLNVSHHQKETFDKRERLKAPPQKVKKTSTSATNPPQKKSNMMFSSSFATASSDVIGTIVAIGNIIPVNGYGCSKIRKTVVIKDADYEARNRYNASDLRIEIHNQENHVVTPVEFMQGSVKRMVGMIRNIEPMDAVGTGNTTIRSCLKATQIRNIEGKMLGKDGKPLKPMRHVRIVTNHNENVKEKSINDELMDTWNDPNVSAMHSPKVTPTSPPKSFLDAVVEETYNPQPRVNFRSLIIDEHVENSDCVLPMEHVIVAQNKFANSLVGFFVGKKVAFQLVQNYVKNTWTKFGFQSVMRDDDDVYYFKFTSMTGLEQILEKGPWLILPVVAYSEDGLRIIATQIGKPIMLDAFTSVMCAEPWGRLGFARALIEVTAEKELKSQVTMAVPMVNGEGHSMAKMDVVYEWKPSRCDECLVFGHANEQCPKRVIDTPKKIVAVQNDGFTTVVNRKNKGKANASQKKHAGGFKVSNTKLMYQPVKLKENASMPSISDSKRKEQELEENGENNNGIKLRNLFDKLKDISYQVDPNSDMGDVGITSDTTKPCEDSDSEVEEAENKVLYCSFIYAGNKTIERRTLWADLDLHKYVVRDFPWVLMGDFNVSLNIEDSYLGSTKMNSAMCDFKDCVKKIEVIDINSFGLHYTWNQKPKGSNGVLKKLDRIMGNIGFVDNFPGAYAIFQPYRISDHSLAVLKLPSLSVEGHAMFQVTQKMKNLKKPLRKLLHDQGNLHEWVNRLRVELDVVQKALDSDPSNSLLRDEEAVYIQAIEVITNSANVVVTGNEVPDVFVAHYESFLGTNMDCTDLDTTGLFVKHVSEFSNANMVRQVSNDEIKRAMFDIRDGKSPGPDGYTSAFFKKRWDMVGSDVCRVVRNFFDNGKLLKEVNHTFLALIPKVTTPLRVNDFRPISCCNVLFKCISKILTNRIIEGIKDVVNENQSAFVPGKRGLRQGDPIYPYLFTLVMEILTLMLQRRVRNSDSFRFHKQCEELNIINLCFADDLFLFSRGDLDSVKVIMESLDEFKLVSGLVPSIPKSTVYFCNVASHVKLAILNIMPFAEGILPVQYLGVPLISSRLLNQDCKILVEKARNQIGDWKNKSLSFAGRLQLCKSMISSMQVYWASVLVITMGIVRDIQQLIRGFLWCNRDYKRGKAKVAWDDIYLPIREGGLGLRFLEVFNLDIMTTHIWHIISNKDSLWVRWIYTYKLRGLTFWDICPLNAMSWGWRKLLQLLEIVKPYFWKQVGNGLNTSIWFDRWCIQGPLIRFLLPRNIAREGYTLKTCVADLITNGAWNWPISWLAKAPTISSIDVPLLRDHVDKVFWRSSNGFMSTFSVKLAWEALRPRGAEVGWCSVVWFSHCIPRHAFNLWLVMRRCMAFCSYACWNGECFPRLEDIVDRLRPMAAKRTFKSIVGKLILAATTYFIWSERNNRLFKNIRRSPEELNDLIMVVVRLKLTTFQFKNKLEVMNMLAKWKLPNNFRIYGL